MIQKLGATMIKLKKKSFKRRVAIALLGLYCIARGIGYLPTFNLFEVQPRGIQLISGIIPIEVWAGVWMTIGIVALIKAALGKDGIAVPLVCGMMMAWGTAFLYGWIETMATGVVSMDWFNASSYIFIGLAIGIFSVRGGEEFELVE